MAVSAPARTRVTKLKWTSGDGTVSEYQQREKQTYSGVKRLRERSQRIPSLDGLRAVSIIAVLVGHLSGTRGFGTIGSQIGDYAHLGVVVFFVISGYLITGLMMSESRRYGTVSLKRFYARRAIRLFPAAFAFIGCLWLLWMAGVIHLQTSDLWYAVTYTVNFDAYRSWQIGHLWSLSVEEQFYFLWPSLFVFLGVRRARWAAASALGIAPLARLAAIVFLKGTPYRDLEMFPMVMDSIAAGCLLALTADWLVRKSWYLRLFRPAYSLGLFALVLVLNRYMGYGVDRIFGQVVINLCVAILIHRSVYCSDGWMRSLLNWRPLAFIGVLSYSLYVWQQLFIDRESSAWISAFPENLILAITIALASYFLLEQPLMKLREKLRQQERVSQLIGL